MKAPAYKGPRCAMYARFSSVRQKDTSIDDQVRECDAKAASLGLKISPDLHFKDEAMRGGRADNRVGYQAMLSAARDKEFEVLFVYAQDRLGRDDLEPLRAIKEMEGLGIRVVMVHGSYTAHQIPVLFGRGRRLFEVLPSRVELEIVRVIDTPQATHIRYRVRR